MMCEDESQAKHLGTCTEIVFNLLIVKNETVQVKIVGTFPYLVVNVGNSKFSH